jgi:hypothetical protein
MKINLKDVTFNIPFKKDSDERLENIITIIRYIQKYFDTNIIVCEQDETRNFPEMEGVKYFFLPASNYILLRTAMLNKMCKLSNTPFIANYDTDVVFPVNQYVSAMEALKQNLVDGIFPYNGRFMNYIGQERRTIIDTLSLENMTEAQGHLNHPSSVGGAIFWNKQKFIEGGMENENFKAWGFEDNERVTRFTKLGYRIGRVDGILFHLNHPTSQNSSNTNHQAYIDNQIECNKVASMTVPMLRQYVNSWPWTK